MAEDVKIYKHFVSKLEEIRSIKRAWFTTFNLDISFFEKYILSALLGKSYQDNNTPYDYEALNAELANVQSELDGNKTEVRVFYDYRSLRTEGKPKQTAVHLHPINMSTIPGLKKRRFKDGVFHPKVTLLETYSGKYWLMVSSANLTLGGWARNRECFFINEITNTSIGRDVGKFFSGIIDSIKGFEDNELLNKLNTGKFGTEEVKWRFLSSFNEENLIDSLNYTNGKLPLKVWSPYFADDLSNLVDEYQGAYFDPIEIIPAKNENQKIRITADEFKKCVTINGIKFKQVKLPDSAQDSFVHAKVWLTPKSIAIGSWNMTRSGMNCSAKANNNLEAGIVYYLSPNEYKKIQEQYSTLPIKNIDYYNEVELEDEKQDILDEYKLSVDLILDWDKLTIEMINPTYNSLLKQLDSTSFINLPGFGKKNIDFLENSKNFAEHSRIFLTDRFFEISDNKNNTLYKGYIREIGIASRPVDSYKNIDDYFYGWVSEKPEEKTELFKITYNTDDNDELSIQSKKILFGNDHNDWFKSFSAFECIINRIKATKEDSKVELKRIGRVIPGNLQELKLHLESLKELFYSNRDNFPKSPIYLWFMIEKANQVFVYYNSFIKQTEEKISKIKNIPFTDAVDMSKLKNEEKKKMENWKKYIVGKLKIDTE